MIDFNKVEGFDWDKGNVEKNWLSHKVLFTEAEEVFFNKPILLYPDEKHSSIEVRYYVLGKTDNNRYLFIVFTIRGNLIRVVSARDMSRKEKIVYEKNTIIW